MATITTLAPLSGVTGATKMWKAQPVLLSNTIDFAAALVAKGSALASSDVIEAIRVPAGCYIHWAGIQTIVVDDATTLTLDLGRTSLDVDQWVDGYNQADAAAAAYATPIIPGTTAADNFVTTADSIDVLFATLTGTLTVGKIRVFALVTDFNGEPEPGIALYTS